MIPPILATILSAINFAIFTTIIIRTWITLPKKLQAIPDDKERNKVYQKIQDKLGFYPFVGAIIAIVLMWKSGFHQSGSHIVYPILAGFFILFNELLVIHCRKIERKFNVKRRRILSRGALPAGEEGFFLAVSLGLLIYQIVLLFLQ